MVGGFCIWLKLLLQTSFTIINEIFFALLDTTKAAIWALLLFHYFVKDEKLIKHLILFTLPVSCYNEFFVITKMSAL